MTALGELVGGRVLDVLPVLRNVHLHQPGPLGPFQERVERFVAARKLSSHPVSLHHGESGGWIEGRRGRRPLDLALRFLSYYSF